MTVMTVAVAWYGKVSTGDYLIATIIPIMLVGMLSTFFALCQNYQYKDSMTKWKKKNKLISASVYKNNTTKTVFVTKHP
jgi:hypothetical protein